jgi:hypothetical protein
MTNTTISAVSILAAQKLQSIIESVNAETLLQKGLDVIGAVAHDTAFASATVISLNGKLLDTQITTLFIKSLIYTFISFPLSVFFLEFQFQYLNLLHSFGLLKRFQSESPVPQNRDLSTFFGGSFGPVFSMILFRLGIKQFYPNVLSSKWGMPELFMAISLFVIVDTWYD